MKSARILHVTPSGFVVAASNNLPKGDLVASDSKGNIIGDVIDVFGPVNSPYLLIKPRLKGDWEEGMQVFLYVKEPKRRHP
ncbi:MAG: Gar1/Naf1 family protein [Thermoprotei archaeon]